MTNLPAVQLSTLSGQITALTERLTPVDERAVSRSLEAMQTAGMTMPKGIDPDKLLSIYGYALTGVPVCGLTVATAKLIKGDYAGNQDILLGVIPKPPVLSALAKLESKTARDDLARKRELLAELEKKPEIDKSPEVMARVRRMRENFIAAHEAEKILRTGSPEPITPERAEYLSQIMALKIDAPNLTAEQLAYRRKAERDINEVAGSAKEAAE